jgi:hypothetical protein
VESFMKTVKVEEVYPMACETFEHVVDNLPHFSDEVYNVSSERTSRYVVDAKRLCWTTSCSAGVLRTWRTARRAWERWDRSGRGD